MEVNIPQLRKFAILNCEIKGPQSSFYSVVEKKLPQFSDAYKEKNLDYIAHP